MKIYCVRHGSTDANASGHFSGKRIDEPLNADGIAQAHAVAEELKQRNFSFDVVITSQQKRAYQTAEIIAEYLQLPIVVRPELHERDGGDLSGRPYKEIIKLMGGGDDPYYMNQHLEFDYSPYGGESPQQVRDRITTFVHFLKENYADKKVIVVGHGGVFRVMYAMFSDKLPEHMKNVSIHEFEV